MLLGRWKNQNNRNVIFEITLTPQMRRGSCFRAGLLRFGMVQEEQHAPDGADERLGGGVRKPHARDLPDGRKQESAGDDDDQPAQQREDMCGQRPFDGGKIRAQQRVAAHKCGRQKVQPQAVRGHFPEGGVPVAVEDGGDGGGKKEDGGVEEHGERQHRAGRVGEDAPGTLFVALAVGAAQKRLHPLGDARKHGGDDQRNVGDHAVCRHARVSFQAEDDIVEDDDDDRRRQLFDEGREAQSKIVAHMRGLGQDLCGAVTVFLPQKMQGRHADADDGRQPRRQHRAEHAHAAGEDKYIVQEDVGKASRNGRRHRKLRRAVVAVEAEEDVVEDEGG